MPSNEPTLQLDFPEDRVITDRISFQEVGEGMDSGYWFFRKLNAEEEAEFRQSARDNYIPFRPIDGIWHPIYQLECVLINHEHSYYRVEGPDSIFVEDELEEGEEQQGQDSE